MSCSVFLRSEPSPGLTSHLEQKPKPPLPHPTSPHPPQDLFGSISSQMPRAHSVSPRRPLASLPALNRKSLGPDIRGAAPRCLQAFSQMSPSQATHSKPCTLSLLPCFPGLRSIYHYLMGCILCIFILLSPYLQMSAQGGEEALWVLLNSVFLGLRIILAPSRPLTNIC